MPRKAKEKEEKISKEKASKAVAKAKKSTKTTAKKAAKTTTKTVAKKKTAAKKTTTKKPETKTVKKVATKKVKTAATKKATTKKTAAKKTTAKKTVSKKTATKKVATKKIASKKKNDANKINVLEYYDLPYRYNQTIVRVLAQTPKTLFVYWDISDSDRQNYINQYGENFFESTKPVLIIHNNTMDYTFEIEINDFANCWYFNINDEKCDYTVELGRRPKENSNLKEEIPYNYLYITSSNGIESPNGHILFEKEQKTIFYRNVKTNETFSKDVANLEFLKRIGRIYKLYDIYHKLYKEDEFLNSKNNPSSRFF